MGNPVKRDKNGRLLPGSGSIGGGRPCKEDSITYLMRQWSKHKGPDGKTYRENLVNNLWLHAIGGNMKAAEIILTRVDGAPTQNINMVTEIEVVHNDDFGEDDTLGEDGTGDDS